VDELPQKLILLVLGAGGCSKLFRIDYCAAVKKGQMATLVAY